MRNKIVIGKWEGITLIINMICTKVFLNFPRAVAETAGTASWILVLYISAISFLFFYIIFKLWSVFEGKDLLEIGQMAGGSPGRVFVGLVVFVFLVFYTSIVLREFTEDMKVIALTVSPISFVTMFFIVCMVVGAYFGIEAILRIHAVAVPIIATGYLIIIVSVLPLIDFTNLLPILGNGPIKIFGEGFFRISVFSELLLLFLIAPFIKTNENFRKTGFIGLTFSAFFLLISAPVYIGALQYPIALENFLPIYQMGRLINYGRFFQRIEPLFVLIWASAALLYLSSGFFFMIHTFKKTFNLEYYKPLIIPFAALIFTLSLLPENLISAVQIESIYFRYVSWTITFGFTILLLIIARLMKRKGRRGDKACG